mgnify:CR=1 FL=1
MEWWKEIFGELYFKIDGAKKWAHRDSEAIELILELKKEDAILDLACGYGRIAIELSKKNYMVMGFDLSQSFLELAKKAAKRENLAVQFVRGDMRRIPFKGRFDCIINWQTSFGYFEDEEDNFRVLQEVYWALKPGGKLLLDVVNRNNLIKRFATKNWTEREDYYFLVEDKFNPLTSRLETDWILIWKKGDVRKLSHSVRIYSLHEIRTMLKKAGFIDIKVLGNYQGEDFNAASSRIITLCWRGG